MNRNLLCLLLALALILGAFAPFLSGRALAAEVVLTITETDIQADSVSNEEGYANLTKTDETWENAPQYALLNADGHFVFPYGQFPCAFGLDNGLFVNGIVTSRDEWGASGVYSLFDLSGRQVTNKTYRYLSYYNGYGVGVTDDTFQVEHQLEDATIMETLYFRELIGADGGTVMTLPKGFSLTIGAGGSAFMFEQRIWGYSYFGNIGGYGDNLMWYYTGAEIENNISEAENINPNSQVFRDNANQMSVFGGPYCGYMDMSGNVVIPAQYYSVYPFSEGLAAVQEYIDPGVPVEELEYGTYLGGGWKYINKSNQTVIAGPFSVASNFTNGYAYVANSQGKYGYIDKNGRTVIPMVYDDAFGSGEGKYFAVGKASGGTTLYGLVDADNNLVVPLEYDDISSFENGVAYAIKNGKLYIIKERTDIVDDETRVPTFTDVDPGKWYAAPVSWAVSNGITSGTSANTFGPNDSCPRAQVVMFLWAANGCPAPTSTTNPFSDIKSSKYYYDAVLWAVEKGITGGAGNGTFAPDRVVTRSEFVTMLWTALGKPAVSVANPFTDVAAGKWYTTPVLWAYANGITSGMKDGTFGVNEPCTRAQVVTFLYSAYGK